MYFPTIPFKEYIPGLIELESCVTLTSRGCWSPTASLNTPRERATGVGQITVAYDANGNVRFDSLSDMRKAHMADLHELSWSTISTRPDLQIRTVLLMTKDNYDRLYNVKDQYQRIAISDAAYNGGLGGAQKERRACGMKEGCDPNVWFGNIEKTCLKSPKILYGKRSACDINRDHVHDVLKVKMLKYKEVMNK